MILPQQLRPGDKIAAISLSWGGPGSLPHRYEAGKRQLEAEFGVKVIETPNALRDAAWLYANPQARAEDLMGAFADPTIRAIFSTIGGDDSIRILPYLDLGIIAANPKIFIGMSDTTVTHMACFKAGLSTCYGPGIMQGFAENGGMFPYVVESIRRTLFETKPIGEIRPDMHGWTVEFLEWASPENQSRKRQLNASQGWGWIRGKGIHRGPLMGGCIEVLDWLRGTDVWPGRDKWEGAILFMETSEEAVPPSTVTRILRTFDAMGILQQTFRHSLRATRWPDSAGPIRRIRRRDPEGSGRGRAVGDAACHAHGLRPHRSGVPRAVWCRGGNRLR